MANSFFTVSAISKEVVRLMENELVMGKSVGTDNLENEVVKSGGSVKVRRQMQYLGQDNNLDLSAFSEDITEGTVTVRRAVVIRDGELKRVVCPQGTFYRNREGWQRGAASTAKLAGGQLSAVRPPTDEERRAAKASKGRLGVGVDSNIVTASIKALLSGVNRLGAAQMRESQSKAA